MNVQTVRGRDGVIAIFIKAGNPTETTFLTEPVENFQAGFIVKPFGTDVPRHEHVPIERRIYSTSEYLLLRKGRCVVDLFDNHRQAVDSVEMQEGDSVLLLQGGHSIKMLADCVFLEVKQGPYPGTDEKDLY